MNSKASTAACVLVALGFLLHLCGLLYGPMLLADTAGSYAIHFPETGPVARDAAVAALHAQSRSFSKWFGLSFVSSLLMLIGAVILYRQFRNARDWAAVLEERLAQGIPPKTGDGSE